jgi:phosphinothricin acetyltransferase
MTFTVRPAVLDDAGAIQAIYAHHVRNGLGTFEETPPDTDEIRRRMEAVLAQDCPWRVAVEDDRIAAYAYAAPFRPRSAYRFTVEDSVYVAPTHVRQGLGMLVLRELVEVCAASGKREMLAVIGDSGNEGSIKLHERCGFSFCGRFDGVGMKFGRWVDIVLMQRHLTV